MRDRWARALALLVPYGIVLCLGLAALLIIRPRLLNAGEDLSFRYPLAIALCAASVLLAWVGFHLHVRRSASFSFSRVGDLGATRRGVFAWLAPAPRALRVVAVGLLAFALGRPETFRKVEISAEGIDIMLVLDMSKSMEERDLRRNRLDAAQRTVRAFLKGRKNDKIGLVVFGNEAMLQCPLTLDYGALDTIVSDLQLGDIDGSRTAIGAGLGLAVASLRRSDAKSKVVILLTDGDSNNNDAMTPEEAMAAAKERGVRVFTVLMGGEAVPGRSLDPWARAQRYATNPNLLKQIAAATQGRYYHAGDGEALDKGFEEVRATLEKSKHKEIKKIPTELYAAFATPALGLLLLEVLLALTRFRKFP